MTWKGGPETRKTFTLCTGGPTSELVCVQLRGNESLDSTDPMDRRRGPVHRGIYIVSNVLSCCDNDPCCTDVKSAADRQEAGLKEGNGKGMLTERAPAFEGSPFAHDMDLFFNTEFRSLLAFLAFILPFFAIQRAFFFIQRNWGACEWGGGEILRWHFQNRSSAAFYFFQIMHTCRFTTSIGGRVYTVQYTGRMWAIEWTDPESPGGSMGWSLEEWAVAFACVCKLYRNTCERAAQIFHGICRVSLHESRFFSSFSFVTVCELSKLQGKSARETYYRRSTSIGTLLQVFFSASPACVTARTIIARVHSISVARAFWVCHHRFETNTPRRS